MGFGTNNPLSLPLGEGEDAAQSKSLLEKAPLLTSP